MITFLTESGPSVRGYTLEAAADFGTYEIATGIDAGATNDGTMIETTIRMKQITAVARATTRRAAHGRTTYSLL